MVTEKVLSELKAICKESRVLKDEPMNLHTTFRIGGKADAFLSVYSEKELQEIIAYLNKEDIPFYVIGNGSNLLVSDEGYRGVILQLADGFAEIKQEGNCIYAEAGALLSKVASVATNAELTGMEFASGIPGSIGGAIVMNAGAYDGEMKGIVKDVHLISRKGEMKVLSCEEMKFGYRHSILKECDDIVLGVTLQLKPGNKEDITDKIKDFAQRRRDKQPLEYPSAGSTFKRPEGYFAGKLIMDAGLKGFCVGGAQVSEKHCGFVINKGDATAKDVQGLMQEVKRIVNETYGVELEPEVIFLGDE